MVTFGKGLEVIKLLLQISKSIVCVLMMPKLRDSSSVVAMIVQVPNPICQQRIERMTIDKNQIGKSRSDRFQYTVRYRRQLLTARNMPDCGMAAVDHRCRTRMEADLIIPEIFRPFSNVQPHQFIDVRLSGAEQSNNISCSVVPRLMDFPIPIAFFQPAHGHDLTQIVADGQQSFVRGFSRESDELRKYPHLPLLIQ